VLLGWLFLQEPITRRMIVAIALILAAVVWIQFDHKTLSAISRRHSSDTEPAAESRPPTAALVRPSEAA